MAENGAEKPDVKKEQGRLDAIDKNDDKKVMVEGKDYGDIVLKKVDATIAKIDDNTGVKDPRILETKSFKAIKERSKQDIAEKLSKIDEKNIKAEAAKLEATLKEIEADFDKVKQYEYSYFEISDRFADRLNTTSQSLEPLLAQIKDLNAKEDIAIELLGKSDVRTGDSFMIKDQTNKEHQRLTIKRIDPVSGKITVTYNGDDTKVTTFESTEHLQNSIISSKKAYERSLTKTKHWSTILEVKISYEKRVVKTTQNVELKEKIEAAQKLMQEQGVLGLQQFVVDANQDIPFGEDIKTYGTLAGMFKEGSLGLQGGKIIFDAKFDEYGASFRADKIKQLKTYLEDTATKANVESEKNPDKKMMRQAELALKQGNIKEARILAINFLEEMKMDPAKLTDEMKCEKARALGIVECVYKGAVQKLQAANERVFGKSALEAMRGVKKYNSMVPGSDGGMAIYEKAFGFMRAKNEKIAAELMKTQSEEDLQQDPAEAYANAKSAAPDVPENLLIFASQGSKTEQVRAAVTDCEQIWNKVASAETSFMQTQDKNQEKGKFIDAIQALRTIGETDNASLYVAEGFRDSMDTVKNANPEAIAKRKQEMIIGLQKNKPSYVKRIEDQLRKDAEAKGERSPDVSQEALNKLVDQSIEKAADEQIQNSLLKDIAHMAVSGGVIMGKGDFYQGKEKEMADLYVKMKNPEGKWLVFSDDDYVQLGDNVIKIALEALVIGVSGGVGSVVASGARLGVSALGGTELLGQAIAVLGGVEKVGRVAAVVAEAGAFEATSKLIAPHITGGPGFTTAGDFAKDWVRSIALFSALKASSEAVRILREAKALKIGQAAGFTAEEGALGVGMRTMGTATKAAEWTKALIAEASAMTVVSTIEEGAFNEHWDPRDMGVAFANNIKMIIGLRMGSKLVHPLTAPLHEAASMIEGKTAKVEAKQEEAKREVAVGKIEFEQSEVQRMRDAGLNDAEIASARTKPGTSTSGKDVVAEIKVELEAKEAREKADKAKREGSTDAAELETKAQEAEKRSQEATQKAEASLRAEVAPSSSPNAPAKGDKINIPTPDGTPEEWRVTNVSSKGEIFMVREVDGKIVGSRTETLDSLREHTARQEATNARIETMTRDREANEVVQRRVEKLKSVTEEIMRDPTIKDYAKRANIIEMIYDLYPTNTAEAMRRIAEHLSPERAAEIGRLGTSVKKGDLGSINDVQQILRGIIQEARSGGKLSEAASTDLQELKYQLVEKIDTARNRKAVLEGHADIEKMLLNPETSTDPANTSRFDADAIRAKIRADITDPTRQSAALDLVDKEVAYRNQINAKIEAALAKEPDPANRDALRTQLQDQFNTLLKSELGYREKMNELRKLIDPKLELEIMKHAVWGREGKPEIGDVIKRGANGEIIIDEAARATMREALNSAFDRLGLDKTEKPIFEHQMSTLIKNMEQTLREGPPELLSGKKATQIIVEAGERLLFQARQSYQRQLGDHGIRHLTGNIGNAISVYAGLTLERGTDGQFLKPGTNEPYGSRGEAIAKGVPGIVKLAYAIQMIGHDLGYATIAGHEFQAENARKPRGSGMESTDAHQSVAELIMSEDPLLRELFGEHFEQILRSTNSHDQLTTTVDNTTIIVAGKTFKLSDFNYGTQTADNFAVAGFEKDPPVVRNSAEMRTLIRGAQALSGDFKRDTEDIIDKDPNLPPALKEGFKLNVDLDALRASVVGVAGIKPETIAAIDRLIVMKKYYNGRLDMAVAEYRARADSGEISEAEFKNAERAISEYRVAFGELGGKFMSAPIGMSALVAGVPETYRDGRTVLPMTINPAAILDMDSGAKGVLGQFTKMPLDNLEEGFKREGFSDAKAKATATVGEQVPDLEALIKRGGWPDFTKPGWADVQDTLKFTEGGSEHSLMSGERPTTPEGNRNLYENLKSRIAELQSNPGATEAEQAVTAAKIKTLRSLAARYGVEIEMGGKDGKMSIRFEHPDFESEQWRDVHDAFKFSDTGSATHDRDLTKGEKPTTDAGYISLYKSLKARHAELSSGAAGGEYNTVRMEQKIGVLRDAMAAVEARYSMHLAEQLNSGRNAEFGGQGLEGMREAGIAPDEFELRKDTVKLTLDKMIDAGVRDAVDMQAEIGRLRQSDPEFNTKIESIKLRIRMMTPEAARAIRQAA